MACFRRKFLHKMWPIKLPFFLVIVFRIFVSFLTLFNTSSVLTRSVQLIFCTLYHYHISKFSKYFWYILGKWTTWCTNSFLCVYFYLYLSTCFRGSRAHHQERQIVSIQPLVTVIICWWPRCLQVGRKLLPTCTHLGHQHRMTITRGCIDTICLSWWWARLARNM